MMTDSSPKHPYEDASLSPENRTADLLMRMSVEDKVGLLYQQYTGVTDPEQPDKYGRPPIAPLIRGGRMRAFFVQGMATAAELAGMHNAFQEIALEHPLGIPVTLGSDPRHAVTDNPLMSNAAGSFSEWPEAMGLAAIGSEAAAEEFADIARQEYLAVGIRMACHPQIDLTTEPRWARHIHNFGEDADLAGRLAAAYVRGFQGPTLGPDSISTMPKHFPGGGPQKDGLDPHFSDGREQVYPGGMFEHHLGPFIMALEAGASQIMPYYGMPVGTEHEEVGFAFNKGIITGILRERLGFDGIVCTDFGVVTGYGEHFPAKAWGVEHLSEEERIERLLDAGVDQLGGESGTATLVRMTREGRVQEARLDRSVRRILLEKFRQGLFDDRRFINADRAETIVGSEAFRAAGIRAQKASLTLLVNGPEGSPTLPLRQGVRIYAEGVAPEAFEGVATVVASPDEADVAAVRISSPNYADPARSFLGSMHKGSLEFDEGTITHLLELSAKVPTILDVYMDRPAVLTPFTEVAALFASFGTTDRAFVEVLFGDGEPRGRMPYDVPRSMAAVSASRTDVPFDTEDPVFRFGHGLSYEAQILQQD